MAEPAPRPTAAGDPFEALGDRNRREILSLLGDGDKSVQEIAAALPISRPAVSRHLRLLKEAGLVAEEPRGTRRIYHLREQGMHAVQAYLECVWGGDRRPLSADGGEHRAGDAPMIEPLRLSFDVACSVEHAFRVWTAGIDRWWPADHTVTGEPELVVLETRVGGRIYERAPGGAVHDWGEVTLWEPPTRLGYLWHLRRDRADATEVEIRFVRQGDLATRVDIEHRGWERLGAGGQDWRDRNRAGWTTLLPHYVAAAERSERMTTGSGTKDDPWALTTAPGTSTYTMYRDDEADPPALVCQVGSTTLKYHLRAIEDLHAWLQEQGDWVPLGAADETKPAADGTVEAWGRTDDNPVGGWYGLRNGYRGRFGMYLPPLLEALGLVELTHDGRNNQVRAI